MNELLETNQVDLMVDLETLGVSYGSPIITIGAVLFDPRRQDTAKYLMDRALLVRVDLEDAVRNSAGADPGTLAWWFRQEDAAIKALVEGDVVHLRKALLDFSDYAVARDGRLDGFRFSHPEIKRLPPAQILWAKSPDFDAKLLEYAFTQVGLPNPFKYSQYRCVRTIQDLAWPGGTQERPKFDTGVKHDARADAVQQAMTVQAAYLQLGLGLQTGVQLGQFEVGASEKSL